MAERNASINITRAEISEAERIAQAFDQYHSGAKHIAIESYLLRKAATTDIVGQISEYEINVIRNAIVGQVGTSLNTLMSALDLALETNGEAQDDLTPGRTPFTDAVKLIVRG